jgi:hypothetical protein
MFFVCILAQPASAHHPWDIRVEVWSNQSFAEPFFSDDPVEIYFRVSELGYVTVYQINPWGGVEIIYPLPRHHWRPVYPRRTYRLIDLAPDIFLRYDGAEGYAYIGIIATPQPVDLVPWLEVGFRECGIVFGRPDRYRVDIDFEATIRRVEVDLRLRLGPRCVPAFYMTPIYVRPRVVVNPPVRVWPSEKHHSSEWRYRDRSYQNDQTPPEIYRPPSAGRETAKSRSFLRHGFERRPEKTPPDSKPMPFQPREWKSHSFPNKDFSTKSGDARIKKEAVAPTRGSSSNASGRKIKKLRN